MYGDKIKYCRKLKGYYQEYMAAKLNMQPGTYGKIETNRSSLSADTLQRIGDILEVSPLKIMENEPMVVNFSDGSYNNGHVNGVLNAESVLQNQKELFDKLEKAKEGEIITLKETISNLQSIILQQNKIIEKLAS